MGRTRMGWLLGSLLLAGQSATLGAVGTMVPWVLNGGATQSADQVLLLDNGAVEARTAFNPCTINITSNFDLTFAVYFGQNEENCGGDGLAFILQGCGANALGSGSAEHAYTGICGNSLAIDFDTYQNSVYGDPVYNSLQLRTGGNTAGTNASTCGTAVVSGPCRPPISIAQPYVTDGLYHNVEISWNAATLAMTVAVDGSQSAQWTLPAAYVASIFGGNSSLYYGWGGSNGGATNFEAFSETGSNPALGCAATPTLATTPTPINAPTNLCGNTPAPTSTPTPSPAPTLVPETVISANLTYSSDDYFDFWINGNQVVNGSVFDAGNPPVSVAVPAADFAAPGQPNFIAAEDVNAVANIVGCTWLLTTHNADGSTSYYSSADAGIAMYDDANGTSPPPLSGSNSWYQSSWADVGGLFNQTPVATTGISWFVPLNLTNPSSGASIPVLSSNAAGTQHSLAERIYFRESGPLIAVTPTPSPGGPSRTASPTSTGTFTATLALTSTPTFTRSPTPGLDVTSSFTTTPTATSTRTLTPWEDYTPTTTFTAVGAPAGPVPWVLVGSAKLGMGGLVYLTDNTAAQSGGMWNPCPIPVGQSFDLTFSMNFGVNSCGADGIAFMMQPDSTSQLGSNSGTHGSDGAANSLDVEFDTYQNLAAPYNDPPYDSLGLQTGGNIAALVPTNCGGADPVSGTCGRPAISATQSSVKDGLDHVVEIRWVVSGNTGLSVFVDGSLRALWTFTPAQVSAIFGANANVWYGFTAATGGNWNRQSVAQTSADSNPCGYTATPTFAFVYTPLPAQTDACPVTATPSFTPSPALDGSPTSTATPTFTRTNTSGPTFTPLPTTCGTPVFQLGASILDGCTSGGAATVTFTNPGGPGQLLLVFTDEEGGAPISGVTAGGSGLTLLETSGTMQVWALKAPATGSITISINKPNACSFAAGYALWDNIDQSTPYVVEAMQSSTANAFNDTLVQTRGGSVGIDFLRVNNGGGLTSNGTPVYTDPGAFGPAFYLQYRQGGAMPIAYSGSCCGHQANSLMLELLGTACGSPTATPTYTTGSADPTSSPSATRTLTVTPSYTNTPTATPAGGGATRTPTPPATLGPKADPGPGRNFVYPQPCHGGPLHFAYFMRQPGQANLHLFNAAGVALGGLDEHRGAGPQVGTLQVTAFADGVYYYEIEIRYDSGEREMLKAGKFLIVRP
jgi:hypothetical protein